MNFQPLKDFLDYYLPGIGVPGSDTVIYKDRQPIFRYQSGFDSLAMRTPVRPDALYSMYSVSKVSTCIAATQLIERGHILTSDPISYYFPEYADITVKKTAPNGSVTVERARNTMTVRHLLTMTAGLDYNLNSPSIKRVYEATAGRCPTLDIVRALASEPLSFEPGERYQYSLCLDVIGGLVELVSGMSFGKYMQENVFGPLGMKDTHFGFYESERARMATKYDYNAQTRSAVEVDKAINPYNFGTEYESGGAGLVSSVDDQILLADALAHDGLGKNGARILSDAGVKLMRSNHLNEEQRKQIGFNHLTGYSYGYGVRVNVAPEEGGNLAPTDEFGWDGAKLSYLSAIPSQRVALFHAEHMGGLHPVVIPRLRNVITACLES